LIKIIIKEENFKWHLEAFASELFISLTIIILGSECWCRFYQLGYLTRLAQKADKVCMDTAHLLSVELPSSRSLLVVGIS